jgi:hypothetical protein
VNVALFRRYKWAFGAAVAAQLLDLVTFLPAVARVGISAERNVLVRAAYGALGPVGPVLLKGLAISLVAIALWWVAARFPDRILAPVLVAVVIGLVGAWSNVAYGLVG